jgi:sugar lactone lactonase YvrE
MPKYSFSFGSPGKGNGQFDGFGGVATTPAGDVYVVDYGHGRVEKFSPSGAYLSQFGSEGSGNGQLLGPGGLDLDSSGNIYIADQLNNRVQKFNSAGEFVGYIGTAGPGSKDGQTQSPSDVEVDSSGNIWVVESGNNRVQEFSSTGTFLQKFGSYGTANGQFKNPGGIAVDSSGNVWVADSGNKRLQKFNGKGEWLLTVTTAGEVPTALGAAADITVDQSGNVWATDGGNDRVVAFNSSGGYLGKMRLADYAGKLAVDSSGNFWITSIGHVEKWIPPKNGNQNWRINGSSLADLDVWEPYESAGTLTVETTILKINTKFTCKESGSGTLGLQETLNLSGCETELNGSKAPECVPTATPIKLNGNFESEETINRLTLFTLGASCPIGTSVPILKGPALTMKIGPEASPFLVNLSSDTYAISETAEHKAHVTVASSWTLSGENKGKKFAYADPKVLNTHWQIGGSSLPTLGAWEPYVSTEGTLTVETMILKINTKFTCKESGFGTLGFQETLNLSGCETELNGKKAPECTTTATPIKLNGNFESEEAINRLTLFTLSASCPIGTSVPILKGPALTMKAGSESSVFGVSLSSDTYAISETAEHKAHVTATSYWILTGKYLGGKFGFV